MSNEELVQLYQLGNESALEELLRQNKGIIHKVIKGFHIYSNSIDVDDLFQEGSMGLMIAAGKYKFDIDKPCKFITYAVYWIRQKISRFITHKNTNEEVSLDTPIGTNENICLADTIANNEDIECTVVEKLYQSELQEDIKNSMLKANTLEERTILEFNFGLNNNIPLSLKQISGILNIKDPELTRRKKGNALRKLRANNYKLPITKYYEEMLLEKKEKKYNNVDNLLNSFNYNDVWQDIETRYNNERNITDTEIVQNTQRYTYN